MNTILPVDAYAQVIPPVSHGSPTDVLTDPLLCRDEKRAILASWASDARAVPDAPSLRRLDNGEIVTVDSVLDAIRSLDSDASSAVVSSAIPSSGHPFARRKAARLMTWFNQQRRNESDDDDPPPCPAAAGFPSRGGFAAELAVAA